MVYKKEEFTYEINKEIGVIYESDNGNRGIELNIITYGSGEPKLDLRNWFYQKNGKKMAKGITLPDDETVDRLVDLLIEEGYGSNNPNKKTTSTKKKVNKKVSEDDIESEEDYEN